MCKLTIFSKGIKRVSTRYPPGEQTLGHEARKGEMKDQTKQEFEQTLGDSGGPISTMRSLACCSPWGRRVGYDLVTEKQLKDQPTLRGTCLRTAVSPTASQQDGVLRKMQVSHPEELKSGNSQGKEGKNTRREIQACLPRFGVCGGVMQHV